MAHRNPLLAAANVEVLKAQQQEAASVQVSKMRCGVP
jgi:hypothetical protein